MATIFPYQSNRVEHFSVELIPSIEQKRSAQIKQQNSNSVKQKNSNSVKQKSYKIRRQRRRIKDSIEKDIVNAPVIVLDNSKNPLPKDFTVPKLTQLKNGYTIDSRAYPSLQLMMDDARVAGLEPLICSSFRTWILRYPTDKSEIIGIGYEPWYYRYVGKEVAQEPCLEKYLEYL